MAGTRLQVDLFFKDKTPQQVNKSFPKLLPMIKEVKDKALRAEGVEFRADYHECFHDEKPSKPCGERQVI